MKLADVRGKAFVMLLNGLVKLRQPHKFYSRGFVIVTYRTDNHERRAAAPSQSFTSYL
jgi:acetoacetate decarboxylase